MNIELANRFVALRREKGYSQEVLAEKMGVSRQAISKWECGEASPDTDNLILLAKIYDVSLDFLLIGNSNTDNNNNTVPQGKNEPSDDNDASSVCKHAGIHMEGKNGEGLHIDKTGIRMEGKNGAALHIDITGIHAQSENNKESLHIQKDGSSINVDGKNYTWAEAKKKWKHNRHTFPFMSIVAIIYIMLGTFYHLWHPAWIIFIAVPLLCRIVKMVRERDWASFPYTLCVVCVYLIIGFFYHLWHPAWVLFLTIPMFNYIKRYITEKNDAE
ncbi:helix-turn-helix domain-containing protein [Pectinatus frisingensis]|uniref:helix-turn-helix domain-containing protein n=1 Tax=Pectinatus frisingensis TaxID=865 RepID=UPI0018C702AF|nr:helix-turn-helix transcriptional regulator [Pectinatus frisingensis]